MAIPLNILIHIKFTMKNFILNLGLLALATLSGCTQKKEESKADSKYKIVAPLVRDTVHAIEYVAKIKAIQNVEVRARVGGYIESVGVDEGQPARKGQLLFTLNDLQWQQDLIGAEAALKSATAELQSAEIELEGAQSLLAKNFISAAEFKLARAKKEALEAKREEALAQRDQAELNLSFAKIRAPFDGVVNRLPLRTGSLVEEGSLLTTISDPGEMYGYFKISELDYLRHFTTGNKALEVDLILANGTPYPHPGTLETTESEFDPNTGTLGIRAKFPNPEELLKHGASGKIRVSTAVENALLIPQRATFDRQEHLCVFVMGDDHRVQLRKITPLLRLPGLFVVQSGLSADEWILCEGIQQLREGDKIIPEKITFSQAFDPVHGSGQQNLN